MQRLIQFKGSLKCALRGLKYVVIHEKNFQTELVAAIIVLLAMVYFQVTRAETIVLFFVIFWVLILELMNTVVERMVDILKPRVHPYARLIKDLMAAGVLISSILSIIIGLIIFLPYILSSK